MNNPEAAFNERNTLPNPLSKVIKSDSEPKKAVAE
jgi:hypothetical protein